MSAIAPYVTLHAGWIVTPYPYEVYGPGAVLCAGNERTFTVLEDVLAEVIETFPSPYIHIGGDEVSKGPWQGCPKCQARMKNEGLETPEQLTRVAVHTGIPEIVAARLASGVLEVSSDGENFTTVQTLRRGTADSKLTGQPVKAVRIRATADQGPNWLMVREFILESASKNSLRTTDLIEPLQIAE
ncbi:MAG: discoidin domain-containing protein [Pirellulaceae bacterium]